MFPLRDSIDHHEPSLATKLLIGANIVAFLWQISGGAVTLEASVWRYGFVPAQFFADPGSEWYRLFTSMFLHGGWGHVLGNLWFLWVFGPALEGRLGSFRYLLLFLLAGAGAALAHGLSIPDSRIPMVGASGAVSAVLGGYIAHFAQASVLTFAWLGLPFLFWIPAGFYLGYWVIIQVIYGTIGIPGTAWWAHVGGFLLGFVLARTLADPRPYLAEPYWGDGMGYR